jgi:hypothetical protein
MGQVPGLAGGGRAPAEAGILLHRAGQAAAPLCGGACGPPPTPSTSLGSRQARCWLCISLCSLRPVQTAVAAASPVGPLTLGVSRFHLLHLLHLLHFVHLCGGCVRCVAHVCTQGALDEHWVKMRFAPPTARVRLRRSCVPSVHAAYLQTITALYSVHNPAKVSQRSPLLVNSATH